MNDFEKKTEQLEKKLHNLQELNSSIKAISFMINVKNLEEHIVEYGVQECWHEYEFMMNEVIYHIHNYIDRLRIILERLPIHEGDCSIARIEYIISSLLEENKSDNNEIDLPGILVRAQDLKLSPKGIRRKSPQVYYPTSDILFDTYSDFFNLAENVLEYMRQISDIFYNAMQEKV